MNERNLASIGSTGNFYTPQKVDVWKMIIKDDANKYQIETEEKRIKKKLSQADYKSYLDRQMDQHKATEKLRRG